MFKSKIVVAAACVLVLAGTSAAVACVGARPLAMGGAFAGLADDVNATYWNPAGLIQLTSPALTGMHTTTNRNEINYQDFVGFAMPVAGKAAAGVSWLRSDLALSPTEIDEEDWYWVSLAYQADPFTSVGLNVKDVKSSLPGLDTEIALDLGILHRVDSKLTVGLLLQDANEPELSEYGVPIAVWKRNWRPGFSYRPDNKTIVSVEVYDATDDVELRSLRVGYEKRLSDTFAARAGYYGLGASDCDAFTFGFGLALGAGSVGQYNMNLDVATMVGDIDVVLTSLTIKF